MPQSLYTRLTHLVTVQDLYTPLQVNLRSDMSLGAAVQAITEFGTRDSTHVSLVLDDGKPVGWTQRHLLEDEAFDPASVLVRQATCGFDLRTLITANVTAWEAVQVFAERRDEFLFVLEGTDVIGTLFYRNLFKPAFRTCLFALTFEVEQKTLQLCQQDSKASWLALDEERRRFLEDEYRRHTDRRARKVTSTARNVGGKVGQFLTNSTKAFDCDPTTLLEHTYFSDRIEIVRRRRLLPKHDTVVALEDARRLRNWCVHPESTDEMPANMDDPVAFWNLIRNCHGPLAAIDKIMAGSSEERM